MEESEETQSEVTVIDANVHNEIVRLKKQKELFLNTKVYNENDALVKMIDAKIQSLCQKAEWYSLANKIQFYQDFISLEHPPMFETSKIPHWQSKEFPRKLKKSLLPGVQDSNITKSITL